MLRSLLEALLLGIVQGLTEFIPVSSSGHLVLVPFALDMEPHGLAFDVALHFGTLGAVLLYFRRELLAMARGLLGLDRSAIGLVYRRLGLLIIAGSIPVAIVGLLLQDFFERVFGMPQSAALFLFLTAALLLLGERVRARRVETSRAHPAEAAAEQGVYAGAGVQTSTLPLGRDTADPLGLGLDRITLRHALLIGLGQCLALFPGVSRSGATIVTGMVSGLTREAATRFSFLLALPALAGAGVLSLPDLLEPSRSFSWGALAIGVAGSFAAGYFAIRFLVALVSRERLNPFAYYCIAAGTVGLIASVLLA